MKCKLCGKPIRLHEERVVRAWGNVRAFYHKKCLDEYERQEAGNDPWWLGDQ